MTDLPNKQPPVLAVRNLVKEFAARGAAQKVVRAVDGISFEIPGGQSMGLVGESGSGKSTTGRLALRLMPCTSGQVMFEGVSVQQLKGNALMDFRRRAQIVFQDPFSSLNPRMTVRQILEEPLKIHRLLNDGSGTQARELLDMVSLRPDHADRYPFEFSGGQRQRISIARALALRPRLLIADEPVSSLDVSVQAQIINLLSDLQRQLGLTLLFISHDLAIVRHLCQTTAVMRRGKIVEHGATAELFHNPQHEYTQLLLSSVLL